MRRRAFLTGLGLSALMPPLRDACAQAGGVPFLDTHLHPTRNLRRGSTLGGAVTMALREMDRFGVSQAILLPPPFASEEAGSYGLSELSSAVRGQPRLAFTAGGESLNPMLHGTPAGQVTADRRRRFTDQAERIAAAGAAAFGEIAVEHFSSGRGQHPYESLPPDHPLLLALADIAARYGMPIEMHMEAVPQDMPFPSNRPKASNPDRLNANIPRFERLLAHNPSARLVWAHAGWDLSGRRTPALMQALLARHANLFMSIKSDPSGAAATAPLVGGGLSPAWLALLRAFTDRFMIGSDQFIGDPLQRLEFARRIVDSLPADLAPLVASQNARRVYRLQFA